MWNLIGINYDKRLARRKKGIMKKLIIERNKFWPIGKLERFLFVYSNCNHRLKYQLDWNPKKKRNKENSKQNSSNYCQRPIRYVSNFILSENLRMKTTINWRNSSCCKIKYVIRLGKYPNRHKSIASSLDNSFRTKHLGFIICETYY